MNATHAAGPGPDQRLPRCRRLRRNAEFQETYRQGRRWIGRNLVLWLRTGEGTSLRLGVVASRKVGPSVDRTRAKRRMRELFRRNRHRFQGPWDVVLVARRALVSASWDELKREFDGLARKAGLFPRNRP